MLIKQEQMQLREYEIINDVKYNSFSKKKFSDNGILIVFLNL